MYNEVLERELLDRLEVHVRAFSHLEAPGEDERRALADAVGADLGAAAGVEKVSTMFLEADDGAWRLEVSVRAGDAWLPPLVAYLVPYAAQKEWASA